MRILYLHRTQAKGVEGVHIAELVKALRRLEHEVDIVSPVGDRLAGVGAEGDPAPPALVERLYGFASRRLPELFFELAELVQNAQSFLQVRRRGFHGANVDMIFERYAHFGVVGAHLAKRWRRPLVVEVNYVSCSPLVRRRSAILRPLARRLESLVFIRATGLAAVSSRLKEQLTAQYSLPSNKIIVLPNAADPEVFDPVQIPPAEELPATRQRRIGFVGGFYPWHGLELLIDAFSRVAPRVTDVDLLLIGDGPMMPAIRRRIEECGLGRRVVLAGRVAHQALPRYIAAFHIGVVPDSNDYGSPMKVFEYMAMGKPVLVPDLPPLLDAVTDGHEGRVFRAGDLEHMATSMEALLLEDGASYTRMSERARNAIVTKHNWLANARAILDLAGQRGV
jgi:glycosyltransferase involved in cell wall biosynthesis